MSLSWKAQDGPRGVYCAPACGGGCKKIDYKRAHRAANALVRRLGKGWTKRVWENLGWHYEARSGGCSVAASPFEPPFVALFGRFVARATTPGAAVRAVMTQALDDATALQAAIAAVAEPR